jgi:protein required for attachment to host cells
MKPVKTLVLVASEAEARILENTGRGQGLREVAGLRAADFPETDQGFDDTAGRQSAAPGTARHAFEPRETAREARRVTFAGLILEAFDQAWKQGGHDRLIIAAPPRLLGELRSDMPKPMADAVLADIPKNLVKVALRDLPPYFTDIAAF